MAPKPKAPVKAPKPVQQKAAPKGLQLSAAQWKAYNAAYTAAATQGFKLLALQQRRQAIQAAAQVLRQSRLSAAYSIAKKTAAAHAAARTAAIALQAVAASYRQSGLAHQNTALRARIYADLERHALTAGRLQYIYKGEQAYAHAAVMRTLDTSQATAIETARFAAAVKTAKVALASTRQSPSAPSAASTAILNAARAAGLAAARALPGPQLTASQKAHNTAHATASKHARQTASATAKATVARDRALRKKGVKAVAKAPRTAPRPGLVRLRAPGMLKWRGDPDGYDCVAAAISNSCLNDTRYRLGDAGYAALAEELGHAPSIEAALEYVKGHFEVLGRFHLTGYRPEPAVVMPGQVIGFQVETGPHAALCLGSGRIASWGEPLDLTDVLLPGTGVEEAWDLTWAV